MIVNFTALLFAFFVTVVLIKAELPLLKKLNAKQEILNYVSEHSAKRGTPTMAGIAFILSITVAGFLFCKHNQLFYFFVAVFVGYGVVGFLDDFLKVRLKRNLGLKPYQKIFVQLAIAVTVAFFVYKEPSIGDNLVIPFANKSISVGKWIVPFVIFVYLACTNGVNLTDGLDGLATTTTICYLMGMVVLLLLQQQKLCDIGDTLALAECENILTVCFVSIGALLAFLLFNCYPAKAFMGDTGSLALGALVACVAIFTRLTLFIPLVGIMYVVSCVSVIVQVSYYKLSKGKRVFLMAPYHHHLQKKGLSETRIAVIYGCVTLVSAFVLAVVE